MVDRFDRHGHARPYRAVARPLGQRHGKSCAFFFSSRRRHTRSYGDWSSDVCYSDLGPPVVTPPNGPDRNRPDLPRSVARSKVAPVVVSKTRTSNLACAPGATPGIGTSVTVVIKPAEIGRASCRERV